jgi:hypothetical protein
LRKKMTIYLCNLTECKQCKPRGEVFITLRIE